MGLRNSPVKFWRQKPINNFIVDFYCPKLKLVIEVDGDSHFTDSGLVYDEERTRILEGYCLQIVHFSNDYEYIFKVLQTICKGKQLAQDY
jgi:very-short-patch-repair endonuclease